MCVRCGTGRIAWCTDPFRHGESTEPVSPDQPPVSAPVPAAEDLKGALTPHQALRRLDAYFAEFGFFGKKTELSAAMDRLWDLVMTGK